MPSLNSRQFSFKNKKSFTLVELLVVVGIIAILSALVITAINPVQLRRVARDSNRKKDIQIVASALEQYYADNNRYPDSTTYGGIDGLKELLEGSAGTVYLRTAPDRQPADTAQSPSPQYCYLPDGPDFQNFLLCAPMEADSSLIPDGYPSARVSCDSQLSLPAGLPVSEIYCVTNPF